MGFRFFTLRIKLALVSVLLLAIPITGFLYASQLYKTLLFTQERALSLTAKAVATILNGRKDLFESNILRSFDTKLEIRTHAISNKITLDGRIDDWAELLDHAKYYGPQNVLKIYGRESPYEENSLNFKHIIGKSGNYYYALFIVTDDSLVFRNKNYVGLNKSDHLQIAVKDEIDGQYNLYFLSPYSSGKVNGYLMPKDDWNFVPQKTELDIEGYWRKTLGGYNIEIRMPVNMVVNGRISFAIADVDDQITPTTKFLVGTSGTEQSTDLGFLLLPSPELETIISGLGKSSAKIRIIDDRLRQRISVGNYYGEPDKYHMDIKPASALQNLLKPVYAYFSDRYREEKSLDTEYFDEIEGDNLRKSIIDGKEKIFRRSIEGSDAEIMVAIEPIKYQDRIIGTVLVEQATNSILSEKNEIIEKTIDNTLIVFILGGIVLFAFTSRLSGRIRNLATQTENAIGKDGRININFKASGIQDELGDLSRRFATMLKQLKEYSSYQEKMADNLEHEIRTPLAGISANLKNLETKVSAENTEVLSHLAGIKDNAERIDSMMTAIREATSLEDALKSAEKINFDIKEALIIWVRDSYKETFSENSFVMNFPEQSVQIYGDPSRIRQMLDKLIENAVDFTEEESPIIIGLRQEMQHALIEVSNEGPELPNELQNQIFDSMVSLRQTSNKKSHLGLGLFVAQKIAEFHGGSIQARNRDDGVNGVTIMSSFPVI